MIKRINQCDIYVGMWMIYMLQGVVYPQGIINQLLQLIMIMWGIMALFKYVQHSSQIRSSILKATFWLIIMYSIYGGLHILFGERTEISSKYLYLQHSLNSLVPIFLFYDFTKNGKLTKDRIKFYLPLFILVSILLYFKIESETILETGKEEITNNTGYMFASLIPLLFFYIGKPIRLYVLLTIVLLFIFMGMKRGAILIGVMSSLILLYTNLKNASRYVKFFFLLLSVIVIIGISHYVEYMINNSPYFALRIEQTIEGNSSGRDTLYGKLWTILIEETNIFYILFGRGADSTINILGNYAHQDWLETFCNNGLVGVIILAFFFYTFWKSILRNKKRFSIMTFYAFMTLFFASFCITFFSMSIQDLNLPQTLLLGYLAYWSSRCHYHLRSVV